MIFAFSIFIELFSRNLINFKYPNIQKAHFLKLLPIQYFKGDPKIPEVFSLILRICEYKNFSQEQFSGIGPSHPAVLQRMIEEHPNAIGIEIPVWKDKDDLLLTGQIDLLLIVNNILYVADYKPNLHPLPSEREKFYPINYSSGFSCCTP